MSIYFDWFLWWKILFIKRIVYFCFLLYSFYRRLFINKIINMFIISIQIYWPSYIGQWGFFYYFLDPSLWIQQSIHIFKTSIEIPFELFKFERLFIPSNLFCFLFGFSYSLLYTFCSFLLLWINLTIHMHAPVYLCL